MNEDPNPHTFIGNCICYACLTAWIGLPFAIMFFAVWLVSRL